MQENLCGTCARTMWHRLDLISMTIVTCARRPVQHYRMCRNCAAHVPETYSWIIYLKTCAAGPNLQVKNDLCSTCQRPCILVWVAYAKEILTAPQYMRNFVCETCLQCIKYGLCQHNSCEFCQVLFIVWLLSAVSTQLMWILSGFIGMTSVSIVSMDYVSSTHIIP